MRKFTLLYRALIVSLLFSILPPMQTVLPNVGALPVSASDKALTTPSIHVLGFLAYDNDLSVYVNEVIERFRLGTVSNFDVQVTLLVDGNVEGDSQVVRIKNGVVTRTYQIPWLPDVDEIDTGDADTLVDFLTWATTQYSSTRTILAMLGHGAPGSPVALSNHRQYHKASLPLLPRGMDFTPADLSSGTYMTTPELGAALYEATMQGTEPFDIVFFDQCFMGNLDVLYEVRSAADIFIASPNYAYSALAYDQYLPHMTMSATNEVIAEAIVTEYQSVLNAENPNAMFWVHGEDVTAIADAVSDLGRALHSAITNTLSFTTTSYLLDMVAQESRYIDQYLRQK